MNQKPLFLNITALALLIIAGAFWVMQKQQGAVSQPGPDEPAITVPPRIESENPIDTSDWKTYRNEEYGFEYSLPTGGRVEYMGAPEPSIQGVSVFHVFSGAVGEDIIILSAYDRRRQSPDERTNMTVFTEDYEEKEIGETRFRIQKLPYLNEEGGRYEFTAWTENSVYHLFLSIQDTLPDSYHGRYAWEYTPTFPNKEFYFAFLSKFRVFNL